MYTIPEAFSITRWVKLIGKKEFVATVFDPNNKIFVVYIAFLASSNLSLEVYPFCQVQVAFFKADKASTFVPSK